MNYPQTNRVGVAIVEFLTGASQYLCRNAGQISKQSVDFNTRFRGSDSSHNLKMMHPVS